MMIIILLIAMTVQFAALGAVYREVRDQRARLQQILRGDAPPPDDR